jgi:hypothetical protein
MVWPMCMLPPSLMAAPPLRVPLYHTFKILFLFWCFLPRYRGAKIVFEWGIVPVFKVTP